MDRQLLATVSDRRRSLSRARRALRWAVVSGIAMFATSVFGAPAQAQAEGAAKPAAAGETEGAQFLRVVEEDNGKVRLEVAARTYVTEDESLPKVTLVSVAHIADKALYDRIQILLDAKDRVLYESVKPAGAARPGGETAEERIASTEASMKFIASLLALHHEKTGRYPADVDALRAFAIEQDPRLAQWLTLASIDAWSKGLHYTTNEEGASFSLISYGADGKPGGEREQADLLVNDGNNVPPMMLASEGGLQAQLADALGLEFQLDAIDYGHDHWHVSDMSMDAVNRALKERGVDFFQLEDALSGGSLSSKVVSFLLRLIKVADAFTEGAITDTVKLVLIETLGQEDVIEGTLDQQFGRGFGEVIVDMRNQVVIDDLKALTDREPEVDSVAIFYGAAHMRDMAERLYAEFGYRSAEVEWIPAIEIDMSKSKMSQRELQQIRMMIRQQMRQMR